MKLDRKLYITMSEEDIRRLEDLAATNTSGNLSALIRSLINRAHMMPSELGLLPPKSFSTALAGELKTTLEPETIPA